MLFFPSTIFKKLILEISFSEKERVSEVGTRDFSARYHRLLVLIEIVNHEIFGCRPSLR